MPRGVYIKTKEHCRRLSESAKIRGVRVSFKGRRHTEETRLKIGLSLVGKVGRNTGNKHTMESRMKMSESWKRKYLGGYVNPATGRKLTEEQRKVLSESHKGYKPSEETRKKLSESLVRRYKNGFNPVLGKTWKLSDEARKNHSLAARKGSESHLWKGGVSPKNKIIRRSLDFKLWREKVFKRDNWTCQECFKRGRLDLHPHHIKPFALYPELRFEPLNGKTLCRECHIKTDSYGVKRLR